VEERQTLVDLLFGIFPVVGKARIKEVPEHDLALLCLRGDRGESPVNDERP
jgi:hypothetical protein